MVGLGGVFVHGISFGFGKGVLYNRFGNVVAMSVNAQLPIARLVLVMLFVL